jgi:hypothetical protein
MASTPCELIAKHIGALYQCFANGTYVKIRTPYVYPDGDVIELFFRETPSGALLTDFGETLRWLDGQTMAQSRTKRHMALIHDVCANHRVTFDKGHVFVPVLKPELIADAITRLAQASIRIADLSFTFRTRVFESFDDEVAQFLLERKVGFERGAKIEGDSKVWPVDFRIGGQNKQSFVYTLSTGSRGAAKHRTDHVVAAFYDLRHLRNGDKLISLFDDTVDVWEPEDFKQLEPHCEIANWSKPDEFLAMAA